MSSTLGNVVSRVSVFAGTVSRTWTLHWEGRTHKLELSHNTITGTRSLALDGVEVAGSQGTFFVASNPVKIIFHLDANSDDGPRGEVELSASGGHILYSCTFEHQPIPEDNLRAVTASDAQVAFQVSIPDIRIAWDEKRKQVVWYRMEVQKTTSSGMTVVHRRFRDFIAVHEAIKASYKGTREIDNLPRPPPRQFFLRNHLAPDFIEERRRGIEMYMQQALRVTRMGQNGDMLAHLGIVDDVREYSLFFGNGPMGLKLRQKGTHAEVGEFTQIDGKPGPAEKSGFISIGDHVSKINGEDVLGLDFDVVFAKLKSAPRPVCVHFIGFLSSGTCIAPEGVHAAASRQTDVATSCDRGEVSNHSSTTLKENNPPQTEISQQNPSEIPHRTSYDEFVKSDSATDHKSATTSKVELNDDTGLFGDGSGF